MTRTLGAVRAVWLFATLATTAALPQLALAGPAPVPVGYVSWDITEPGASGQFDIVNLTGENSSGDGDWPVLTAVSLSDLNLAVNFTDGTSSTFGSSYFTLSADGYSFDGSAISIGVGSALPTDALLTGMFHPTIVMLFDGQAPTIAPSFSASIDWRAGGLSDGDLQLIEASPLPIAAVPEPRSAALLLAGLIALWLARRPWRGHAAAAAAALCAFGAMVSMPASAAVKLSTWTAPSSGTAGSDYVNVTATGVVLATGQTIASADVTLTASCGGAPVATVAAASAKRVVGTSWRIQFILPGTLGSGTYAVAISGASTDGSTFAGSNCSQVAVTAAPGGSWTTLIGRDWALSAGNEGFKCIVLPVTEDMYISAFHAVAPPGDYQRLLTVSDTPFTIGAFDCNGSTVADHGAYMSGTGGNDVELPPGAAVRIRAGQYLVLNLHLFNESTQPASGQTEIQIRTIPAASVTALVEMQMLGFEYGALPADAPAVHTLGGHCFASSPFDILALAPRMNALGTRIQVTRTSADPAMAQVLLDKPYSVSSELTYSTVPPVHAVVGDLLAATCSYVNSTGSLVGVEPFGYSYSEQCLVGVYRTPPPPPTEASPFFRCPSTGAF